MTFDFKKEYKSYYLPGNKPQIINIPKTDYLAVYGSGDPNLEDGEYKRAIASLYGIAYTIKMSKKTEYKMKGYFDFTVPPLEGLWWQDGSETIDYTLKDSFNWIALLRLPEFVTKQEFDWAVKEATEKKKQDFSNVKYLSIEEGLCVQCMHTGPYDNEPATVDLMNRFIEESGYESDISASRRHHEIYLSDPRKTNPDRMKTVIRHPIKKKEQTCI